MCSEKRSSWGSVMSVAYHAIPLFVKVVGYADVVKERGYIDQVKISGLLVFVRLFC